MDEVGLLVLDDLQLMFQPQEKLHALLEHGDRVVALLLPTLWGLIAFRGHEFIEHGVVLFELLVQPLIIGFLAYMNDGDQIDFDTFLTAGREVLGYHGLQGDWLPVFTPLNADESGFGVCACSRQCWYQACQYQQRLEDETHSLPPLNGPADRQRRLAAGPTALLEPLDHLRDLFVAGVGPMDRFEPHMGLGLLAGGVPENVLTGEQVVRLIMSSTFAVSYTAKSAGFSPSESDLRSYPLRIRRDLGADARAGRLTFSFVADPR